MSMKGAPFPSFGKLHFVTKTRVWGVWCDPDVLAGKAELKSFKLKSLDKRAPLLMCRQRRQPDHSIVCYLPKQNLITLIEIIEKKKT